MAAVLGIDAAWTVGNPSGVALAVQVRGAWRLVQASACYADFLSETPGARPLGGVADPPALLANARLLADGEPVAVVAVDMPLSLQKITARRPSDNAVSRAFGAMKCATHSPSEFRPGAISEMLTTAFEREGYPLGLNAPLGARALIEVYPHPALVRLCGAAERLPYKHSKTRTYWPALDLVQRREALVCEWEQIVAALDERLSGASDLLRPPEPGAPTWMKKAFEDTLDAAICAWVGVCALEDRAEVFGDDDSAIWVPSAAD